MRGESRKRNYILEDQGRFGHIKATETGIPVLGALAVSNIGG